MASAPKRQDQHYVPQFYLRNFSYKQNRKQIGIFFATKEFFYPTALIKGQAHKPYFYGKDGTIEEDLGKIENELAPIIANIIDANQLPARDSESYRLLLLFTILSELRTPTHPKKYIESTEKKHQLLFGDDKTYADQAIFTQEQAVKFAMKFVKIGVFAIRDLNCKLIINDTATPFITSDNPVIKYNQILEHKNQPGGLTGYSSKGLQIFVPVSPKHLILFYDQWAYKVDTRSSQTIVTGDVNDINQLNLLQFVNCDTTLYFNDQILETQLKHLYTQSKKYEKANKAIVTKYDNILTDNDYLIHTTASDCKIGLNLSFIKFTKQAKKFDLGNRSDQLRKSWSSTEKIMTEVLKTPFTRFFTG